MGQALCGDVEARGIGRYAVAHLGLTLTLAASASLGAQPAAPYRLDNGRFTFLHFSQDARLARSLAASATRSDTFPGLPRPNARILIAIAPDERRFREWVGPAAPEWGAAIAIPEQRTIILHGRDAGSEAGDPQQVLRHEIAHLVLHEFMGDLPPRWFDEGYASYAAGEWGRDDVLATSFALVFGQLPSLDSLNAGFAAGASRANAAYALAHRAVAELASLDAERGLTLFLTYWKDTGSIDRAIRAAFGLTQAQFEARWRQRTRRRFGGIALAADLTLGVGAMLLIILPLYVARRRRDRRRMAALQAADELSERAARDSALEGLLRVGSPPALEPPPKRGPRNAPQDQG